MNEASALKSEDLKSQKVLWLVLIKMRIAWLFFLFIVINPLIKAWLNPDFNWSDVISFGHVSREFLLFILILLALGLGLTASLAVRKFLKLQNKMAQYLISFILQSSLFICVPILGFSISLKEANPSLVFLYSAIGVLLLTMTFPTRRRWKLSPEEEKEFIEHSNTPRDIKYVKNRRIIFAAILSLVLIRVIYGFIQSQRMEKVSIEQCRKDCFDLFNKGELQPNITAEMCIEKSCQ